jgi:hypothetical protein
MTNRKNKQKKTMRSKQGMNMASLKREINKIKNKPSKPTPFSDVGSHLGNMLGFKDLGRGIGGVIGRIFGSGDYTTNFDTVRGNALATDQVPAFGGESTIITHREYVKDIISSSVSGLFKIEAFRLNPTNDELFPWLSTIAQNYEEYSFLGVVFEFKSMSGHSVASTNTQLGSVFVATQYDPLKPAFTNKIAMENYFFSQSTVPSQSILHAIECKPDSAPIRTLYTSGATTGDKRFEDFGTTYVASQGLPGTNVNMGELWVTYKVALKKPRLSQLAYNAGESMVTLHTEYNTSNPLGQYQSTKYGVLSNKIGITGTDITIREVAIRNTFLVNLMWSGDGFTTGAGNTPTLFVTNGVILTNDYRKAVAATTYSCGVSVVIRSNTDAVDTLLLQVSGVDGNLPPLPNRVYIRVTAIDDTSVLP